MQERIVPETYRAAVVTACVAREGDITQLYFCVFGIDRAAAVLAVAVIYHTIGKS